MFQVPPLLLTLSLAILHSPFFHAIPIEEEQRHQTIHHSPHTSPAHPSELINHQEAPILPRGHEKREDNEERPSTQMTAPSTPEEEDELFKDISPKALAAVLLQALNGDGVGVEQTPSKLSERNLPEDLKVLQEEKEDSLTERVKGQSQGSDKEMQEDEKIREEQDIESVKSLLQELEGFEPPPKRDPETDRNTGTDSDDLEELRELLGLGEQREEDTRSLLKSSTPLSRKWGADEEGENLAGAAQDLLLQYVLNGGGNGIEQDEEENGQDEEGGEEVDDYQGGNSIGSQRPLFEDEEEGNIQEKRSKEDDGEEVDPQTIDKLIELSSRLHLPADDVVDIINDVEKRKRRRMKKKKAREDFPGRKERTRAPQQSWGDIPKPVYYPRRKLEQDPIWNKVPDPIWNKAQEPTWSKKKEPRWNKFTDPSWNNMPESRWNKVQEPNWKKMQDVSWNTIQQPSWNKVNKPSWNKGQDVNWNTVQQPSWNKVKESSWKKVIQPAPRRYRPRPVPFPNYIRPRAFQTPPRYYYKSSSPQRDNYFDEDQDKQEEMENYIERILLTHPEVFQ